MSHSHDIWHIIGNTALAIVGFIAQEYIPIVGTIAVTVSALNGMIALWRSLRRKPPDATAG